MKLLEELGTQKLIHSEHVERKTSEWFFPHPLSSFHICSPSRPILKPEPSQYCWSTNVIITNSERLCPSKGMRKLAPVCPSSVTMTSLYKIGSPGCHGQENPAGSPPLKTLSLKKEQARFTSTNIQTGFWDDTDVAKLIVFSRKNKFVIVIFTLI